MSSSSSLSDILNSPLSTAPDGQASNFVNPPSTGYAFTVVCSIFLVIEVLFFLARLYGRGFVAYKLGWDDVTCTIGFLLTVVYYGIFVNGVQTSYIGYHAWDVTVGQLSDSSFYVLSYLGGVICPCALGFIKLTFFILYMQIFRPLKGMKVAIWAGAISSTIFYVVVVVLAFVFTTPRVGETWATHLVGNEEENEIKLSIPQAAISVFFDFYILILPIMGVWQLQLSRQRKIAVAVVFLTGGIACLSSILTLYYRVLLQTTDDILTILVPTLITSLVEMQIGVICSCALVLPLVVRKVKESSRLGKKQSYNSYPHSWQRSSKNPRSNNYISFGNDTSGRLDSISPTDHEMGAVQSVQTSIGKGIGGRVEEDSIHLTYSIQQDREPSREAQRGKGQTWASRNMV